MTDYDDQSARYVIKTDALGTPKALASTNLSDILVLADVQSDTSSTQLWYFEKAGTDGLHRLHTEDKGDSNALSTFNTEGRQTFELRFSPTSTSSGQDVSGQYWLVERQSDGNIKFSNNKTGPGLYLDIDESSSRPFLAGRNSNKQLWTVSSLGSTPTSTQISSTSLTSTSTPTATPSSSTISQPKKDGLSKGAIAGIAIGAVVAVLALIALIWFVCCRGRRKPKEIENAAPARQSFQRHRREERVEMQPPRAPSKPRSITPPMPVRSTPAVHVHD
ncbi:hypothetical protein ACN47E_001432 [Coniothyrium glycines]